MCLFFQIHSIFVPSELWQKQRILKIAFILYSLCLDPSFIQHVTGFVVMTSSDGSETKGNKTNNWPKWWQGRRLSSDYQKTMKRAGCWIYQVHLKFRKKKKTFLIPFLCITKVIRPQTWKFLLVTQPHFAFLLLWSEEKRGRNLGNDRHIKL